mgnify:CR=1 FL=1
MRLFEIILSIVNVIAFCSLVIQPLHPIRWIDLTAPAALLIAVAEVAVEGFRWQMVPAYALALIFLVIWLLGRGGGLHVSHTVSFLGIGCGIRSELFTADSDDHRELMAQVWYPAKTKPSMRRVPYIEDADVLTPAIGRLLHLPDFVFSHLQYVNSNAVAAAPFADDEPSYPVLLYLSGIYGFRAANTFQIEELVSHGYIVVGLDQPGIDPMVRFSDGRRLPGLSRDEIIPLTTQSAAPKPQAPTLNGQPLPDGIIPYFAQDASFALDQLEMLNKGDPNRILTGRLDLAHIGTFGVSLGGTDAGQACLTDPRLKACLTLDANTTAEVAEKGLRQPTMFITRSADTMRLEHERNGTWQEKDIQLTVDTMRAVYENLPGDGYYIKIPGIFHINFTDVPYWSPLLTKIGWTGPINTRRGFDIINAYSVAFFDRELKGRSSPILEGQKPYPEVKFESLR